MTASPRGPKIALVAFLAIMAIVHGVIAWLSPIQADDWGHWSWAAQHATDAPLAHVAAFVGTHITMSDWAGYLVARVDLAHTIVTPLVGVALVIGMFTLAMRRLPRLDSWDDVLGVVLASALIWIAAPRAGLIWFHRPYATSQVWTCALMVWVIAPYRCGWQVRGSWLPAFVLGALVAGTSTRQLGLGALIGLALVMRATPRDARARWMWLGLGAIAIGAIVGLCSAPYLEIVKFFKRGLEANLGLSGLALRECGEVITLVMVLVFVSVVLNKLRPTLPSPLADPDSIDQPDLIRWLWIWFGLSLLALFGPHYSEALIFAPAVAVACAALPVLRAVARVPILRVVIVAIAIGVHVVAWAYALPLYVEMGAEYRDRMDVLAHAPRDSVATIPTYTQVSPSFMFYGEDWGGASSREIYALQLFGLRDIVLATDYRRLEENPDIEVKLETTGASDAQVTAALPRFWGKTIGFQRAQFKELVEQLQGSVGHAFTAHLVVTNVAFPQLAGRPLYSSFYDGGGLFFPKLGRSNLDANNRYAISLDHASLALFTEAWIVTHGQAEAAKIEDDDRIRLMPVTAGTFVIVLCDHARCVAVDAFVPRF